MGESTVEFDAPFFRSTLEKIVERANDALQGALINEALALETIANADAPVKSGELVASSFNDAGPTNAGNPAATVGYDAPFAGAKHEGFHFGDKRKTAHQFWLQKAANQFASGFTARMADAARRVVGR